jgi:exosortase
VQGRRADRWSRLSQVPRRLAPAAIVALAALYIPVFAQASAVWSSDAAFSFAYLAPPSTAGLLWLRRREIRASLGPGSRLGLLGVLGGLLLLADWRLGVPALCGVSFIATALGVAAYRYGRRTARALAAPCSILGLSLCLYRGLLGGLGGALQRLTAVSAAELAGMLGAPVQRDGVDLFTAKAHFVVAGACSGLGPLLALLCLGILLAGLTQTTPLRKALLIALIAPIEVAVNIGRVTLELALSGPFGLAVAQGLLHDLLGVALFLCALGMVLLAERLLRRGYAPA